jgi:hypothetical protein
MLGEQLGIGRLDDFGRRLFHRQPSQLTAVGQVLDRQDPTVASLDRLAPLLEVGGPDGPWLPPRAINASLLRYKYVLWFAIICKSGQ